MRHDEDDLADKGRETPHDMHEEDREEAVYLVSTAALRNMVGSAATVASMTVRAGSSCGYDVLMVALSDLCVGL